MRSGPGVRSAAVTVGREVESEVLARVVQGARAGRSACALVVGEGGVGKSRLLHDATEVARRAGIGVAAGRAAISAPAPFSLIAEALRSWLRGHPPVTVPAPFGHGLRLILPEWPDEEADDLTSGQLRLLALEAMVRLLREVADEGALLVVDDLHAADPESLEAIRYAAAARVEGLAIIAALRPDESPLADELVRALRGDSATALVELDGLDRRAVTDLVTHLLGAVRPAELVTDAVSRTDGVPLFVEEVVDAHLRAGSVVVEGGSAHWRGGHVMLPRSVRGMVTARLERLPQQSQDVLLALAVAGTPEPPALVSAVAAADERTVAEALRHGIEAGLLATSAGVIGFRHDIIRESVIDAAVPQVVAAMHRRAAAALADDPALARLAGELSRTASTTVAAADALAAVLTAQGRWAEALEIDESTVRERGGSAERRQRMASAALEAGYPDRAQAALTGADTELPATRALVSRLALVRGDAAAALAEADAVLAGSADTDTRLAALEVRARALDFLDERAAAREAWSAQVAEAPAAARAQAELRPLFQRGKQQFVAGGRPVQRREAAGAAAAAGALVEL